MLVSATDTGSRPTRDRMMQQQITSSTGNRITLVAAAMLAIALFSAPATAAGNFPNQQDWQIVNRVFDAAIAQQQQQGTFGQNVPSSFVPVPTVPAMPAATGYVPTVGASQPLEAIGKSPESDTDSTSHRGGVWRLELGNEDRGVLEDVFEPILPNEITWLIAPTFHALELVLAYFAEIANEVSCERPVRIKAKRFNF